MPKFGTAIILAGGKSRRMGFDKQFLIINEERLITKIAKQLKHVFTDILVVTNEPEAYQQTDLRTVSDIYPGLGPLAGIHVGLTESQSEYAYVIACDMPQLSLELIEDQIAFLAKNGADALVTRTPTGYLMPFHGFYSKKLITPLAKTLEAKELKLQMFLEEQNINTFDYERIEKMIDPNQLFTNLNTVEELENYLNDIGGKYDSGA